MKDYNADLVVIGGGAAGFSAALTAAMAGRKVTLLEASDKVGGTTALSGALLWVPANRWQQANGEDDSLSMAREYVRKCLGDRAEDPRWDVFFDNIHNVVDDILIKECGLEYGMMGYPDSFGEWPEGRCTRHIAAKTVPIRGLGEWAKKLRQPAIPGAAYLSPLDLEKIGWLNLTKAKSLLRIIPAVLVNLILGRRGTGSGLIAGMLKACLKRGVEVITEARVSELVLDDKRVTGVKVETPSGSALVKANCGVVLACGGFSWDEDAKSRYLPGPYVLPQDPPTNRGDNIRLAGQAGANLQNLGEAWNIPSYPLSEMYMGEKIGSTLLGDRMLPHQIWVNKQGQRFTNEASQNAGEAFYEKAEDGTLKNYPCFSIFDQQFRDKYSIYGKYNSKAEGPDDLVSANSLDELAGKIGVDAVGLKRTVNRYNGLVHKGEDSDFGRGSCAYEQYFTGPEGSLGTIKKAPFYALPVYSGGVGTKGGAMTNANGCVVSKDGGVIEGLYAAGNAAAAFNGPITVAAGCTIPPALVMGHVSAKHAIGRNS